MSAFLGVFFREKKSDIQRAEWKARLEFAYAAHGNKQPAQRVENEYGIILKLDFEAYADPGHWEAAKIGVTALAGHPHLRDSSSTDRYSQLQDLATQLESNGLELLSSARGTFALAHIAAVKPQLTLVSDSFGVRPLYYYEDAEKIVFSSTLSVFGNLPIGNLIPDARGQLERAVLGFCLADRTLYKAVKAMPPAHAITFTPDTKLPHQYWKWGQELEPELVEPILLQRVHESFMDAVRIRAEGDSRVMAFLTGGLDSRCVVAALRNQGIDVNSLNFAPAKSQDFVFGALIADVLKTTHHQVPMPAASVASKISVVMPEWLSTIRQYKQRTERPHLVWSGDGGSVGLGHVYLTEEMIELAQRDQDAEAIDLLLTSSSWVVPAGVLKKAVARDCAQLPFVGMLDAFKDISCRDRGRGLHILLMVTDQRQHLCEHFEQIYRHECDLQLPFFDKEFMAVILNQPIRPFMNHRFYNRWMELFGHHICAIPWQAYPGHEASAAGMPDEISDLEYQWQKTSKDMPSRQSRRDSLTMCCEIMRGKYKSTLVSRPRLFLAAAATSLGVRDYAYIIRFAHELRNC